MKQPLLLLCSLTITLAATTCPGEIQKAEMAGYLLVSADKVPDTFNAGFSLYTAAWPLLQHYPGHRFQTGLFGTWMHAQYEGKPPADLYSDIEGGLGWWRDTRFPTETPKFIMGGVAVNFKEIANGPAHGAGNWKAPRGLYGVAQLSPWLLFPIDGLDLKQGTCGELFGYGYLPLPLTTAKATTNAKNVPTGDNCWTLFLNTNNFKGPVCFFTPYFWSHSAELNPAYAGLLLDSRPSAPNKPFQMETQYVPAALSMDQAGDTYAQDHDFLPRRRQQHHRRPAPPHLLQQESPLGRREVVVRRRSGRRRRNQSRRRVRADSSRRRRLDLEDLCRKHAEREKNRDGLEFLRDAGRADTATYGYKWSEQLVKKVDAPDGSRVVLPEYFHLQNNAKKSQWVAASASDIPAKSGLAELRFERPEEHAPEPYDTPDAPESSFKKPGPVAGPFKAHLGDGSVVTYCWYRFADQPALLNADLTIEEREKMQARVEKLHRAWTKDRDYLAPPTVGKLADLDPAQIVTPPKGFEVGFVPIATRQEVDTSTSKK